MAATSNASPLYVVEQPELSRLLEASRRLLLGGGFGWIAGVCALQFWAAPGWSPPQRGLASAVLVGPIVQAWVWRDDMRKIRAVVVRPEAIELHGRGSCDRVRCSDVLALVGDGGVNLDGGELVDWKRLTIATDAGRHVLRFDAETNAELYDALRMVCPRAWGLRFPPRLDEPDPSLRPDGSTASRVGLGVIAARLRSRIVWKAGFGLVLATGGLAMAGLLAARGAVGAIDARGLVALIVGVGAGLSLTADAARSFQVLRMVRRMEASGRPDGGFIETVDRA